MVDAAKSGANSAIILRRRSSTVDYGRPLRMHHMICFVGRALSFYSMQEGALGSGPRMGLVNTKTCYSTRLYCCYYRCAACEPKMKKFRNFQGSSFDHKNTRAFHSSSRPVYGINAIYQLQAMIAYSRTPRSIRYRVVSMTLETYCFPNASRSTPVTPKKYFEVSKSQF